jgi:hypothetical protein
VAGRPVIQATGRLEFEDGLGSGDFVSGYSYHMSVRTGLPDPAYYTDDIFLFHVMKLEVGFIEKLHAFLRQVSLLWQHQMS